MSDTPASTIRAWARANDVPVGTRGRIHPSTRAAYDAAHAKQAEMLAEGERWLLDAQQ